MNLELSDDEAKTLVTYARKKYSEERYPLSRELLPLREILEKTALRRPAPTAPKVVGEPTIAVARARSRRQQAGGLYGQL